MPLHAAKNRALTAVSRAPLSSLKLFLSSIELLGFGGLIRFPVASSVRPLLLNSTIVSSTRDDEAGIINCDL